MNKEDIKEMFINICRVNIERYGIINLLKYITDETDFFEAPASSEHHLAVKGGLAKHSFNVYSQLTEVVETFKLGYSDETIAICGLFHDLCKANFYKDDIRNKKIDGKWHQVPYYSIDDKDPYGHGEKSVIILQQFIKLTKEEILAIRYHMGAWGSEGYAQRKALSAAIEQSKLLRALMLADQRATYFLED